MSRTLSNQQIFLPTGNPDTTNSKDLYATGELGTCFDQPTNGGPTYQRVQVDSGATSATPTGVLAANQVMFWKSRTNRIVTNDSRMAIGGTTANAWRNQVAGILRVAATPGYYVDILKTGNAINVLSNGSGGVGQTAIADSSATTAGVIPIAVGTASTYEPIGVYRSDSGNLAVIDVDISNID